MKKPQNSTQTLLNRLFWSFSGPTLLLGSVLGFCVDAQAEKNTRPNIVVFVADDLGWSDLGYTGSSFYESPNIDALSKRGMIFTNAYSNGPNCAPSRASLMSGM
ncbi:MAG: sulfatase-like hydrolase/transferase, partial [Dehalococcoidia bacterium]|nr:sulfatase-like hydrolase/transferase [Dehalococcoidia bacterium]